MKALIQTGLERLGYRLVPRARDAKTILASLRSIPFRTVIDVGAHHGHTALEFARVFPSACIHAIEPDRDSFDVLRRNVERLPTRIVPWNFAASATSGTLQFFRHLDHLSSSSLLPPTPFTTELIGVGRRQEVVEVCSHRLDDVLAGREDVAAPLLMKLDTQGTEDKVLAGSQRLLELTDALVCEINLMAVYQDQPSLSDIVLMASAHNLSFAGFIEQFHLHDGTPIYVDALFLRRS